jgi:hypothetical protein
MIVANVKLDNEIDKKHKTWQPLLGCSIKYCDESHHARKVTIL